MRVALSILGTEVIAIDTNRYDEPSDEGSVTATGFGFGESWHNRHNEFEETP